MPAAIPEPPATPAPALAGGLVHADRSQPGIRRVRVRGGFRYRLPDGRWLRDEEHLAHIRRLAIPPAYSDVWICPQPNGHLQATGRDARGRLQYRYHPDWRHVRDASKFERLLAFGRALPRIRARVARDLEACRSKALSRPCVLATIVRLLDTTFLRVGNEEYAVANGSYGLTTLRTRHADVRGSGLRLRFRGKSGVEHEVHLDDPRVARVVRRCRQLPGQALFQYQAEDGSLHCVDSGDVNAYLDGIAASVGHFTAKDFRTWHGTVQALELTRAACLRAGTQGGTGTAPRRLAREIVAEVARQLGNTPAVCRKSYIHPAVLALAEGAAQEDAQDALQRTWARLARTGSSPRGLSAAERRLMAFLQPAPHRPRAASTKPARATRPAQRPTIFSGTTQASNCSAVT